MDMEIETNAERMENEWLAAMKLRSVFDIQIDAVTKLFTTQTHLVRRYLDGNAGTKEDIMNYCLCLLLHPDLKLADFDADFGLNIFTDRDLLRIQEYLELPGSFETKMDEIQTLQFCPRDTIFFPESTVRRVPICSGTPSAPLADEPQDLQRKLRMSVTKCIVIHGVRVLGTVEYCAIEMALNMRRVGQIYTTSYYEPFAYYVMRSYGRSLETFEILMDKPFVAECGDTIELELLTDLPMFCIGLDYRCGGTKSFHLEQDGEGKTVFVEVIYSAKPESTGPPVCYL